MTSGELRAAARAGTWLVWLNVLRGDNEGKVSRELVQAVEPSGDSRGSRWSVRRGEGEHEWSVPRRELVVATAHDLLVDRSG